MRISRSLVLFAVLILVYQASGQCRIINDKFNSVYITYERVGTITLNGVLKPGIVLRLRNNSNCAIHISVESGDSFDLKTDPVLPDVLHRLRVGDRTIQNSGDAFQLVKVDGGKSSLFGIPFDYLSERDSWIEVPFRYLWEDRVQKDGSTVSVEHLTHYAMSYIPKAVAAEYNSVRDKKYPAIWFAPITDPNKPDWEILPQEAKAGEVILSKRNELGILSNFAATPFEMDKNRYASVEGFWQSMLYPEPCPDCDPDPRMRSKKVKWKYYAFQVAQMTGFEAKAAGTLAEENMKTLSIDWCTYGGKRFLYRSRTPGEHYRLIVAAMRAKLEQNPEVKRILLATGDLILKPDHHGEENPQPKWKYNEIWMQLRTELQRSIH